jgi:hypothetical protein
MKPTLESALRRIVSASLFRGIEGGDAYDVVERIIEVIAEIRKEARAAKRRERKSRKCANCLHLEKRIFLICNHMKGWPIQTDGKGCLQFEKAKMR